MIYSTFFVKDGARCSAQLFEQVCRELAQDSKHLSKAELDDLLRRVVGHFREGGWTFEEPAPDLLAEHVRRFLCGQRVSVA
jgi:hypothetical protein